MNDSIGLVEMESENITNKTIITHVIPTIGRIQVELFEPASSIFSVFRDTEIKRLNNLSQLGQLSLIHSGAHHTRWDYVMLKLYLLKTFKQYCPGSGLASEVPCLNLRSGLQTIQAYSLLRNFGHLEGCFETERIILEACVEKTNIRRMLVSLVPSQFKKWAQRLINNEDNFRFYQLLSVIFTEHSKELENIPDLKKQCIEILYRFLVKPDNRMQILKARHAEIRTLAYLALDTHYAPIGLEYNLGSILVAAREFGQKLFGTSMSRFQGLSEHVNRYVSDTIYMSPEASWAFLEFRSKAYKHYLKKLSKYKDEKTFLVFLKHLKKDTIDWKCRKRPVYTKLYLPPLAKLTDRGKLISKSKELSRFFEIQNMDHVNIVSLSPGRLSHAYIYHPKSLAKRKGLVGKRYRYLLQKIVELFEIHQKSNPKSPSFYLSQNVWSSIDSLFRSVFYLITNDEFEITLERIGIYDWCSSICCRSRPKAEERTRKILKSYYLSRLPKQRMAELECVLNTIKKSSGGFTSACFSNIKILRKSEFQKVNEEYEVAEIDGAVLSANKWHTKLYFVEGKKQKSGSSASARKQLKKLISKKIKIAKMFDKGIEDIVEIPGKGAYLSIKLP